MKLFESHNIRIVCAEFGTNLEDIATSNMNEVILYILPRDRSRHFEEFNACDNSSYFNRMGYESRTFISIDD